MNAKRIDLPETKYTPVEQSERSILSQKAVKFNLMIKQGNTWYAPKIEAPTINAMTQEEV